MSSSDTAPPPGDPELTAIAECLAALGDLDRAAANRVVSYLAARQKERGESRDDAQPGDSLGDQLDQLGRA